MCNLGNSIADIQRVPNSLKKEVIITQVDGKTKANRGKFTAKQDYSSAQMFHAHFKIGKEP